MPIAALVSLFIAVFVMMAGNGLITTLVPLRGVIEGFSSQSIGAIGSAYFVGMLAGTWVTPSIVGRAGHIRAFAAYAAIAGTAALGFAIAVHPVAWMALRLIIGFCFAGLFAIIESWINDKATNQNRGRLLALQNIVHFSGSAGGQQILRVAEPTSFSLFSAVAGLYMLSVVPLAMTRQDPPGLPSKGRLDILGLLRASPIGVVGMILVGLANATFWSLVPAYVDRLGLSAAEVATFMTCVILGSAVGPYPIGRLSDRFDRRVVIIIVSSAAALLEIAFFVFSPNALLLYVLAFLLGLCLPVLYSLISAHTNDRTGRERMVAVSSTLLFLYCVGGIIGPLVTAQLISWFGQHMLFAHNALVHLELVAFVVWRMTRRAAPVEKVAAAEAEAETPRKPIVS